MGEDRSAGVYSIVASGIEEGQSYRVVQEKLNNYLGTNAAKNIAHTETQWAVQEGRRQTFLDMDIGTVIISTALDACPICDGVAFEMDGTTLRRFDINSVKGIIPVHPNCRCSLQIDWTSISPDLENT